MKICVYCNQPIAEDVQPEPYIVPGTPDVDVTDLHPKCAERIRAVQNGEVEP